MATPPPHRVTLESHISPPWLRIPCHPAPLGYLGCQLYGPRSASYYSSDHHDYENLIQTAFQHQFPQSFIRAALSSQAAGQRWEFRHFLHGGFSPPSRHIPVLAPHPGTLSSLSHFSLPSNNPWSHLHLLCSHVLLIHMCPAGTPCQLLPSPPGTYMCCELQPAPIIHQKHPNIQPQRDYDPERHCLALAMQRYTLEAQET